MIAVTYEELNNKPFLAKSPNGAKKLAELTHQNAKGESPWKSKTMIYSKNAQNVPATPTTGMLAKASTK